MSLFSFFKRDSHRFPSNKFQKVVGKAISFLEKSPTYSLPIRSKFSGCGVYVLYYIGELELYKNLEKKHDIDFSTKPMYVGKAVPSGWRKGRKSTKESYNLWKRIKEHANSIAQAQNLDPNDFKYQYMILDGDLVSSVEAALIRQHKPLWNCVIDGFGNHHVGRTRFYQAKPDWDVLHAGRPWADNMLGDASSKDKIIEKIGEFLDE